MEETDRSGSPRSCPSSNRCDPPRGGRGPTWARTSRASCRPRCHVNANPPSLDYMVATAVSLKLPPGLTALPVEYPKGKKVRLAFADEPLSVYEEKAEIEIPIQAYENARPGAGVAHGTLRF